MVPNTIIALSLSELKFRYGNLVTEVNRKWWTSLSPGPR